MFNIPNFVKSQLTLIVHLTRKGIKMSRIKLGKLLRRLRKEQGISLRKLAEKVDVSFVNISHIENGRVSTSKETLTQIANALNYDLDKLLAIGDEISDDLESIIRQKPDAVPAFLRSAKNLTKEEWQKLTEQVEKMQKDKE